MSIAPDSDPSDVVRGLLARHGSEPTRLLQILVEVQAHFGHIPSDAIDAVAAGLWLPRARVEGVISFYSFLYTTPHGEYDILLSDNITDRMLGNQTLLARLCGRLEVDCGETCINRRVSLSTTSCTGMCDQGPAALVNGRPVTRLSEERVGQMLELMARRVPVDQWPPAFLAVEDNIRRRDALLGEDFTPGEALRAAVARGEQAMLAEIVDSGLRGRGGAGFATGLKWRLARETAADTRYVVCNADEGEPGTFKDRVLLARYADLVVEGMTLCARVIGARRGFLYLRGEYRYLLDGLNTVLARRRQAGLLGEAILGASGFDFDVDIHVGAGAYVCGEESALLESLEGKRGIPRKRPPFPVTEGYLGSPTVVNNVETFAAAAWIGVRGGAWHAGLGTAESKGTKLLSVSGDCRRPGVYEYPFGVRVEEVLADCGAVDTQAVQISGAAGTCLPASAFDRRLAFEDLPTGGSFMVFDHSRDMWEVACNFAGFFAHESCGFCTPCRVGTTLMKDLVDKVARGQGTESDLREMRRIAEVMRTTSHCGLGATAANPVMDVLARFPDAYAPRLKHTPFEPPFDLDGALAKARRITGREDAEAHL